MWYHGTSESRLQAIEEGGWIAQELYLADQEAKSWEYAEFAAEEDDDDVLILLTINPRLLDPRGVQVDSGSSEEEWEQDMGQWTYSGPLGQAIVSITRE